MKSFRSISLDSVLDDPRALPWRPTRHEIYKYWLCLLLIFLRKCAILYNRIKLSSTVAFAHSFVTRRLASPTLNNTGTPCPATVGKFLRLCGRAHVTIKQHVVWNLIYGVSEWKWCIARLCCWIYSVKRTCSHIFESFHLWLCTYSSFRKKLPVDFTASHVVTDLLSFTAYLKRDHLMLTR